jgi:hypothetical protein
MPAMKATRSAILALAAPAALLALRPGTPSPEPYVPSAETIEVAVSLAHAQAREAGGRPGPVE